MAGAVLGPSGWVVDEIEGRVAFYQLDSAGNVTGLVGPSASIPIGKVQSRTIAVLGDSISYQNTNGSNLVLRAQGYIGWACVLSGGRLTFSNSLNFGVAGDTSTQVLARTSSVIAAAPAFCVVHCGTNDVYASPSITHATTVANLAAIYAALVGAGIVVVAVPILPRSKDASSGSMATAERQKLQRINNWIRRAALTTPGVILADPTLNIIDLTASNGDPLGASTAAATAYTYDGLHPAPRGAFWMGKAISDALSVFLPPASLLAVSQIDTYSATNNPTGNLLTNGWFTGTGGTAGTGASGSIASSWTLRRTSGTTGAIVGSKTTETVDNGTTYATQTVVVTAAAGSSTENLQILQTTGSNFTAGTDVIYGEMEVRVSSVTADSLRSIQLNLQDGTSSAICLAEEAGFYLPNGDWNGVLRTPSFTIASAATTLGLYLNIIIDGTVSSAGCTVEVCRAAIRKVES